VLLSVPLSISLLFALLIWHSSSCYICSTREGEPFTAFLDGPNIGYYMQNFDQGKFNVYQIDFILNALEDMGETPLVIMPQKYCLPSFTTNSSRGRRQNLLKSEMAILERFVVCIYQ